ncbi:MAG: DUF1127 domain-containing protein [Hyphomicrobiaceae bacterium]
MSTQHMNIEAPGFAPIATGALTNSAGSALAAASAYVRSAIAAYIRYRTLKLAERQLLSLNDRMLRDIGLDRTEIMSALINAHGERLNGAQLTQDLGG